MCVCGGVYIIIAGNRNWLTNEATVIILEVHRLNRNVRENTHTHKTRIEVGKCSVCWITKAKIFLGMNSTEIPTMLPVLFAPCH